MLLDRFAVLICHVEDVFDSKNPPRRLSQFEGSVAIHPSGMTAKVWCPEVEMKTFTSCAGVPIRIGKELQGPSLPCLASISSIQIGVEIVLTSLDLQLSQPAQAPSRGVLIVGHRRLQQQDFLSEALVVL
jgi:hypothetical protein